MKSWGEGGFSNENNIYKESEKNRPWNPVKVVKRVMKSESLALDQY